MIILGIDPGFGRMGYGAIRHDTRDPSCVVLGCIETAKELSPQKRLHIINSGLERIIEEVGPHAVAIEKLFFAKNTKTALGVAEMRGVILLLAEKKQIPIREFTPLEVKVAVTGYGKAQKHQVQYMVQKLLHLSTLPEPDDAADALAIAITAAYSMDRGRG